MIKYLLLGEISPIFFNCPPKKKSFFLFFFEGISYSVRVLHGFLNISYPRIV